MISNVNIIAKHNIQNILCVYLTTNMAWYGNHVDASRKLDQLIEQNPTLQQLLDYPQFIQQLKAYNPKLLDYLTNSGTIIIQIITYITVPPKDNDSQQRKYRLPTMSMQLIESQAMSVINGFFKQDPKKKQKHLLTTFQELLKSSNRVQGQVLPLLAGYFLRLNICLLNNKYKQTIDCMYQSPINFQLLLQNSHNLSATNVLQVYLNLDLTKNPQTVPERLNIKIKAINSILRLIDESVKFEKDNNNKANHNEIYFEVIRVENLSSVLIQLLEKYYLIADGKQMVDQILYQQCHMKILFQNLFNKNTDISTSLFNVLISVIKFYSLSSFNAEQWNNPEQRKKNEQKLESHPAIVSLCEVLPILINQLSKCKSFSIYQAKTVELINASLSLNSHKIFNCVKNGKYIQLLIQLLFRFQTCNIFGIMVQKVFTLIFRTQRIINEEIKHYIFCQAKIIDLTAARYLTLFQNDEQIVASMQNSHRRRGYFGHLMKLMKIYSGIQTTDQDIINAIKNKSQTWNKISRLILKPYEAITFKQLSTYENIPECPPTQFTVKTIIGTNDNPLLGRQGDNTKIIDQINLQQAIQNLKTLETNASPQNKIEAEIMYHPSHKQEQPNTKVTDDEFFDPPAQNSKDRLPYPSLILQGRNSESAKSQNQTQSTTAQNIGSPSLGKKSASYSDFIQKQKVKAETQIRKQRSRSKQRALSKGKTKITSPSPTKRVNKWAQDQEDKAGTKQPKEKVSLTGSARPMTQSKNLPKIPNHKRGINVSSNNSENTKQDTHNKSMELQIKEQVQNDFIQNKSMPNLDQLKRVKIVYHFQVPAKRQFRKITQEDKVIFNMLGIAYS